MNMGLLGLLGLGMPASQQLPQSPSMAASSATLENLPEEMQLLLREQFTNLLKAAELRLQPALTTTKPHTDGAITSQDISKIQDFFKTLAKEQGEDIIAGIMPVTIQLLEEVRFQQSFVAGVAFSPTAAQADTPQPTPEEILAAWQQWLATPIETIGEVTPPVLPATNLLPVASFNNQNMVDMTPAEGILAEEPLFTLENAPFLQIHEEIQIDTIQMGNALYVSVTTALTITPVQQMMDAEGNMRFVPAVTPTILTHAMKEIQQWQQTALPALPVRTVTHGWLNQENTELSDIFMQDVLQGKLQDMQLSGTPDAVTKTNKFLLPMTMNLLQEQQRMILPDISPSGADILPEQTESLFSQQGNTSELSADGLLAKKEGLLQQPEFVRLVSLSQEHPHRMTPTQQIIVQMMHGKLDGQQKMTLQLYPEELGRVDVQLNIDSENNVMMRIVAENSDAYDVLRADKSNLERILQEMGLKLNEQSLAFSHRESGREGKENQNMADDSAAVDAMSAQPAETQQVLTEMQGITLLATTGINIKV